jgi:hypothetical protein
MSQQEERYKAPLAHQLRGKWTLAVEIMLAAFRVCILLLNSLVCRNMCAVQQTVCLFIFAQEHFMSSTFLEGYDPGLRCSPPEITFFLKVRIGSEGQGE